MTSFASRNYLVSVIESGADCYVAVVASRGNPNMPAYVTARHAEAWQAEEDAAAWVAEQEEWRD